MYADKTGVSQQITDKEVKELVDEARAICPEIEVEELVIIPKQTLAKKIKREKPTIEYTYYLFKKGNMESQCLLGGSGYKKTIMAWLFGFINGSTWQKNQPPKMED